MTPKEAERNVNKMALIWVLLAVLFILSVY